MTATQASVTLASRVTLSEDALVQEVGGEAVILDLAGERYFGLDPVGTRIWALLGDQPDLASVHAHMCEEFDAEPERIEADLLGLVRHLAEAGLVKVL